MQILKNQQGVQGNPLWNTKIWETLCVKSVGKNITKMDGENVLT